MPLSFKSLANAKPSPPLLPLPAKITALGSSIPLNSRIHTLHTSLAAFSIRTIEGIPISELVALSILLICSAVTAFMN